MGNRDQLELTGYFRLSPKLKAGKAHDRFDMSKRRLDRYICVCHKSPCPIRCPVSGAFAVALSHRDDALCFGRFCLWCKGRRTGMPGRLCPGRSSAVPFSFAFEDEKNEAPLLQRRCSSRAAGHRRSFLCQSHPPVCRAAGPDTRDPGCRRQCHAVAIAFKFSPELYPESALHSLTFSGGVLLVSARPSAEADRHQRRHW